MEVNIGLPSDSEEFKARGREEIRPFDKYNSATGRGREVRMIASVGRDGAIGRGGDLIWHLPGDLPRFKTLTMGHPVVMGRLTFESLPKGALPGRRNIVVSRRNDYAPVKAELFSTVEEAIAATDLTEVPYIIGGGQIYAAAMPYATHLFITRVDADCPDADTFFPSFGQDEWVRVESSEEMRTAEGVAYRFEEWVRR